MLGSAIKTAVAMAMAMAMAKSGPAALVIDWAPLSHDSGQLNLRI